jgi:catechol 2,3-dioxygenase-like lactoylglutathione lyase family enzyme
LETTATATAETSTPSCCSGSQPAPEVAAGPVKFHTSLNVSDLARSVAFYRVLFDREPAKRHSDYAKFEVDEPPLILSLIPGRPGPGGNLNHVGLRVRDSEELVKIQHRLEAAGFSTKREEGVECCYSRQTKFWVTDPDRALWELYVLHEDTDDHGHDTVPEPEQVQDAGCGTTREPLIWEHHLVNPVPDRIPHDNNTLDRVMLKGTANLRPEKARLQSIVRDAFRALRPGGEIFMHSLGADRPVPEPLPTLPGPASSVQFVPTEISQMQALVEGGFVEVRFEKLSQKPYFVIQGAQLREVLLAGRKPGHRPRKAAHQAIYLGPLAEVRDDFGNVFRRGDRVPLNIHDWTSLSKSAVAGQFLFLPPVTEATAVGCCS